MPGYKEIFGHRWSETGVILRDSSVLTPCLDCYDALWCKRKESGIVDYQIIPNGFAPVFDNGIVLDLVKDNDAVCKMVTLEIKQDYDLDNLDLKPGDVVVDIGAHKGVVSCYLAKRYPGIKIYAYEPLIDNYLALVENAILNDADIEAYNFAVTGDGRDVTLHYSNGNTGGANVYGGGYEPVKQVKSVKFADVLGRFERIALLKIDCEGAEFELDPNLLDNVDAVRGEFHGSYGNADALFAEVKRRVKNSLVSRQS
jgi:FkbM family methyltransferase